MEYSNSSPAASADNIIGYLEAINESGIHGWAYQESNPSESVSLQFYIDDVLICDVPCTMHRADVLNGGHPRAEVGFYLPLPRRFFDGAPHIYRFAAADGLDVCLSAINGKSEVVRAFTFTAFFDADFYVQYYPDAKSMDPQQAFAHWLATGRNEGRFCDSERLLAHLADEGALLPERFSAGLYRFLNREIGAKMVQDWQAKLHYLTESKTHGKEYRHAAFAQTAPGETQDIAADASDFFTSYHVLLRRNGILSDSFLRLMNVTDYATSNGAANLRSRLDCIRHFAEHGIQAIAPLSFEHAFDHVFISELDATYGGLSAQSAYLRWINAGVDAGVAPNPAMFLTRLGLRGCQQFPEYFDPGRYLAKNPGLRAACPSRWAALAHFVEHGLAANRLGCPISTTTANLYLAVADQLAMSGRPQTARRIYEAVLEVDAVNTVGLRHYGDCLHRLGEHSQAARIYQVTIATGQDNVWTSRNLAACYARLGRWEDACRLLDRLAAAWPGDPGLRELFWQTAHEAYAALATEANWLAQNKFYDLARDEMNRACGVLAIPFEGLKMPAAARGPIRDIAIVGDFELKQCRFYRIEQKAEQLEAAGIGCQCFNWHDEIPAFLNALPWLDAVIFYRVPATPAMMRAIYLARQSGIPVFYEIDDLLFDAARFPDSFASYGGQISHDLYATLVTGAVAFQVALSACEYAIASTPALAETMRQFVTSGQSFVHRNALGRLHEQSFITPRRSVAGGKIRIFYGSGTKAHDEDFEQQLAPSLARLLSTRREIELLIMGYLTLPAVMRPFRDQIRISGPIWDLRTYWRVLAEVDINLAVLKPGLIADCKSEIKWLEAAMLGVPSVVTATQTYREVIEDGKTGMVVCAPDQWFSALDALIAGEGRRQAIGQAARAAALRQYAGGVMAVNLLEILKCVAPASPPRQKILICNVFFAPQAIGGATRVVMDNVRDLAARHGDAFALEIFTTIEGASEPYVPSRYLWEGVAVTAVTAPMREHMDREVWDQRMADYFIQTLRRFKPDLVHFHCIQRLTTSLCEAARAAAIPYLVTVHDGWWISDQQFLVDEYGVDQIYDYADPLNEIAEDGGRLARMLLKQEYLAAARQVLAVSEPFAAIYRRCGFGNVVTVANGASSFTVAPRRASPDGRVRLAHIGGTSFHKGYHLVRAALLAGRFENLSLLVVDHALEPAAESHTQWGTTPVTFRGKIAQANIGILYAEVDVLLAPSVWAESYGLVTREAALAGCWVVASDRGAIGLDVTPDNGFIVAGGSLDALLGVLAEIDRDPARFLTSPPAPANMRTARAQANELAGIYRDIIRLETDWEPRVAAE